MRKPGCLVCDALWLSYGDAVMEHVRTSGKLQIAMLQHDAPATEKLRVALLDAHHNRQGARASYLGHIEIHSVEGASSNA